MRLTHICPKRPRQAFANTKFIEIGAGSNLLQKAIIFVRIVVQTLLFRPDIIYVHQSSWMNKLGGKLACVLRKPVVLDLHGSATQEEEAHPGAEDLAIIQQKERKALNEADLIIVVSPELKDFVQERFGVPEEVLVILPNGVNRSVFTPPRACSERIQELRRTLGISETNRIATFVCPRNGQVNEIALKWFFNVVTTLRQKTNDLRFLIVGGERTIQFQPIPLFTQGSLMI